MSSEKNNDQMKYVSMLLGKCPSCGQTKLFKESLWSFKNPIAMNESCANCGENFQKEPGFYFGAAYVSYGITVALWVAVFVALYCFNMWGLTEFEFTKNPVKFFVWGIITLLVLLLPIYRLSRSIWLGLFVNNKK